MDINDSYFKELTLKIHYYISVYILSYIPYLNKPEESHRRLLSTPGWVDFVVIVGLLGVFYYLLRVLRRLTDQWKQMMQERIDKALAKRKLVVDPFRNTYGYSWDFAFIFRVYDASVGQTEAQKEFSLKKIINLLADSGLETKNYYSVQRDEVYVKVRCNLKRLMIEADRINYKLPLDPGVVGSLLSIGNLGGVEGRQWSPIIFSGTNYRGTSIEPFEYLYTDFRRDETRDIYKKQKNGTIFRGVDRLKLIANIIKSRRSEGGCALNIQKLINSGAIIAFFPLHDAVELKTLEEKWLKFFELPWHQNLDIVKDYFGEKIGLYFSFLNHYTTWLIVPAILGFITWINVAADDNDPSAALMPYYACFMAIWSTCFIEAWKRKEKTIAMKWGMIGYEEEEVTRTSYIGDIIENPVDGSPMRYYPRNKFYFRLGVSYHIIITLIIIVIGVVASIFYLRIILSQMKELTAGGIQWGGTLTAIINAVQIQVLNALYNVVAIHLTEYENHRTDTMYEDALIMKTFIFQFVNSFSSIFYISFVKPYIPQFDTCIGSCMRELQSSLGTIFLTRLATNSILKVAVPYFLQKMKFDAETKGTDPDEITEVERTFILDEYHVILGTFRDYADLMIQFGYTTMFICAYPLATVMSFVSNYVGKFVFFLVFFF